MRWSERWPLRKFREYLVNERQLSAATAESYVKQTRRFWRVANPPNPAIVEEDLIHQYDATLSVKVRENFRAAWRHYVEYSAKLGYSFPLPPSRKSAAQP